jgi:phospholipase/carboxylesterase
MTRLISSTLYHKIRQPAGAGSAVHPALILLHGMGTNEDDLLGLADYVDPRFFTVSARAPYPFNEVSGGYTWYDVREIGRDIDLPDRKQFEESHRRLAQFVIDVKRQYPVDGDRVFLFGFSMGSVISLALALTNPGMVRGIVAHSGYIREVPSLKYHWNRLDALSLFVAHGIHDPVVPIHLARRSRDLLIKTKADLTYKEYPIAHAISEQSLHDLSGWLVEKQASGRSRQSAVR